MKLLGNYQSNLTAFLYQELLTQLETAITAGEFAAGTLFDTASAQAIQKQGQSFSDLTVPASGSTAYSEDVNRPLNTLEARYAAIANEVAELKINITDLLAMVDKESTLVDQIIAAAEADTWAAQRPPLTTAARKVWSFAAGHGITTDVYPDGGEKTDPSNDVIYPSFVPLTSLILNEDLSNGDGTIVEGIGVPVDTRTVPAKNIQWVFTPNSDDTQFQEVYGEDQTWALLSALEPEPLLIFGSPSIQTILPFGGSASGIFTASGSIPGGGLPVYVRVLFHPRQVILAVENATSGQTINLSLFNVTANITEVYDDTTVYQVDTDFQVSDVGVFTVLPGGALVGASFNILFIEYYPAYQCSIDQSNWGPIIMLDATRPYPDDTVDFIPINIQGSDFPLTDELGVPIGLFIRMVGRPLGEMVLKIIISSGSVTGETAKLTVDLERVRYLNGLQLAPFTNYPIVITSIVTEGFTSDIQNNVLDVPVKLDREIVIRFPRHLVRRFTISVSQENYSLKEYIAQAPDSLRRNTLSGLQSSLPFSVRRPQPAIPQKFEGATYELGFKSILALDRNAIVPGVFVSGPYLVSGSPELLRLDTDVLNISESPTPSTYIAFTAYDANDATVDEGEFIAVPGTTVKYPSVIAADHVNFYVKFVLREELSVAKKLLLQVTTK